MTPKEKERTEAFTSLQQRYQSSIANGALEIVLPCLTLPSPSAKSPTSIMTGPIPDLVQAFVSVGDATLHFVIACAILGSDAALVHLRDAGLEPDFGSPLESSDARAASSAGEPGSSNFVSQGRGSAATASPTDGRNYPYHHPKPGHRGWRAHRRRDSAGHSRESKT